MKLTLDKRCVSCHALSMSTNHIEQESAMYTVAAATAKHVRYAHREDHPDADEQGHVTFVNLSWGDDFIATAMPGHVLVNEALILAVCEMNSIHTPASPIVTVEQRRADWHKDHVEWIASQNDRSAW